MCSCIRTSRAPTSPCAAGCLWCVVTASTTESPGRATGVKGRPVLVGELGATTSVLPFRCRLDVGISAVSPYISARALPHGLVLDRGDLAPAHPCGQSLPEPTLGLVGQTFSSASPRRGATDVYPSEGRFKTTAMAEGAIEGKAADYELPSAFATRFAFSRFGESLLPPSANAADGEALHDDSSGNAILEAAVGELEEPGR